GFGSLAFILCVCAEKRLLGAQSPSWSSSRSVVITCDRSWQSDTRSSPTASGYICNWHNLGNRITELQTRAMGCFNNRYYRLAIGDAGWHHFSFPVVSECLDSLTARNKTDRVEMPLLLFIGATCSNSSYYSAFCFLPK